MKYQELLQCAEFFKRFKLIDSISRVENNTLKIDFENKTTLYTCLKKGSSTLFMCDEFPRGKRYTAPFDVVLTKRFSRSQIKNLYISPNDRVLNLEVIQNNSYKMTHSTLLLEFTGKNTNAIILDDSGVIVEALRHIDRDVSYRVVKVGEKLAPLPKYDVKEQHISIADVKTFLYETYEKTQIQNLENFKASKCTELQKKVAKIESFLRCLESETNLKKEAKESEDKANLLLANRYLIDKNAKEVEIKGTWGEKYAIVLHNEGVQKTIDELFTKSKKLKQRAKSIYVERENLSEKLEFSKMLLAAVLNAKTQAEVEILLPNRKIETKKEEKSSLFSSFFAEGYKIMVGKNAKGNVELLKLAKKNDVWFHVKDTPSSHVILRTDKSVLPDSVISFCAKLCLNFSKAKSGLYEVDYTQRRNIRVCEGSHVNYVDFKTLKVEKG